LYRSIAWETPLGQLPKNSLGTRQDRGGRPKSRETVTPLP